METTVGLECRDLSVVRTRADGSRRTVIEGLQARFPPGAISLVSGPNGAGKSTLLHVLAGLLRPTAGEVMADGRPVSRWTSAHRDRWRRQVGIVFQQAMLLADLTVMENLLVPMVPRGMALARLRNRGFRVLEALGIRHMAALHPRRMSAGERQRAAVGRALMGQPRFFLADEPTAHQDEDGLARVVQALQRTRQGGAVVVVTSHDPRLMDGLGADDAYRLVDGRLRGAA